MAAVQVVCPSCRATMKVALSANDMTIPCGKCGEQVKVLGTSSVGVKEGLGGPPAPPRRPKTTRRDEDDAEEDREIQLAILGKLSTISYILSVLMVLLLGGIALAFVLPMLIMARP